MAKNTVKLTDKEIKASKPREKEYNLFDGDGLRLKSNLTVQSSGSSTTIAPQTVNDLT
ncbi:TPA: hypothetical protein PX784_001908 [Vibrio cholerae]|nr:hypothetical protein [Vibrio cholerae]